MCKQVCGRQDPGKQQHELGYFSFLLNICIYLFFSALALLDSLDPDLNSPCTYDDLLTEITCMQTYFQARERCSLTLSRFLRGKRREEVLQVQNSGLRMVLVTIYRATNIHNSRWSSKSGSTQWIYTSLKTLIR